MKDRLKYVIDSRYFDGTCLTSMSDGFHNDYGGETIEELRIRENNPYLKAVTPSDIDKKLRLYNQSLSEPFKEITEEDFTAKDFRCWAGSVSALHEFQEADKPESQNQAKRKGYRKN